MYASGNLLYFSPSARKQGTLFPVRRKSKPYWSEDERRYKKPAVSIMSNFGRKWNQRIFKAGLAEAFKSEKRKENKERTKG
jgi:hypothetical protein